jgi:Tfp pilus assembly protein PilO
MILPGSVTEKNEGIYTIFVNCKQLLYLELLQCLQISNQYHKMANFTEDTATSPNAVTVSYLKILRN